MTDPLPAISDTGDGAAGGADGSRELSVPEAEVERARLKEDLTFRSDFLTDSSPGHGKAVARMNALDRIIAGGEAAPLAGADGKPVQEGEAADPMDEVRGVPPDADGYDLRRLSLPPDDAPEIVAEALTQVRGWSHEARLSQGELDGLVDRYNTVMKDEGWSDIVSFNPVATGNATSAGQARVSAADTLAVTYCNPTAGALTPASGTAAILAFRS